MNKKLFLVLTIFALCNTPVFAQSKTYEVKSGDTMWKIAVANQIGLSEIIAENPSIKNPALIYPGQKINIPNIDDIKSMEKKVMDLVNAERSKKGLPSLKANWELSRIARYKCQDMIDKNYFSHQSPTYGSPFDMIESFGIKFSAGGENIAKGQQTPEAVMNAWMNSEGHRANILSSSFSEIGVGLAKSKNGTMYWTQMFIRPTK